MANRQDMLAKSMAHALALEPFIKKLATAGITGTSRIANALNDAGHPAIRGGLWLPPQVEVLLQRLGLRD